MAARERVRDDAFGAGEVAVVGQRVAEHRGEADVLEGVGGVGVFLDAALEQGDRRPGLPDGAVGAGEALGERGLLDDVGAGELDRLGQERDRLAAVPLPQRDTAEACEALATHGAGGLLVGECVPVQTAGLREVVETQRDLGVEQVGLELARAELSARQEIGARPRAGRRAGGEVGSTGRAGRARAGRRRRRSRRRRRARAG